MKLVTYTFAEFIDIWPIYFGQLDEFLPEIDSVVISNSETKEFGRHKFISKYDNNQPYWKQWVDGLEKIDDDFFIYMQEDFFLFGKPDITAIENYCNLLKEKKDISFIKLIKTDAITQQTHISEDMFLIHNNEKQIFSMQPTIWKRKDFITLYKLANNQKWFDTPSNYYPAAQQMKMKGIYIYRGESKRGMAHFDSSVFPYVATGLVRKKWNVCEYRQELKELTEKYGINMNIRGFYNG